MELKDKGGLARAQIKDAACRIISGQIDALEGCRIICRARFDLPENELHNSDIEFICAIESELDEFPLESEKHLWNAESFNARRKEYQAYFSKIEAKVLSACQALAKIYG